MITLLSFVILIVSIIAHEVAHGYAADSLGDPTPRIAGRLTLNPLPHIDPAGSILIPALLLFTGSPIFFGWAKPVPYNPYNLSNKRWGEALVAIAGSATNLLIAIIFGFLAHYGAAIGFDATALSFAATISFVNLFLGLFNMIPFPPLDGFTALRAALPWNLSAGMGRFEHRVRGAGILSLLLFLFLFSAFLSGPFFHFVAWIYGLLVPGGG